MLTRRIAKVLPYRPEQLYKLVADVESYPQFLPWCLGVRITARSPEGFSAEVAVGRGMIREKFTSHDVLKPATTSDPSWRIEARSRQSPFKLMENHWSFAPHPEGSAVDFGIRMDFESSLKGRLFGGLFTKAVDKMVSAFERRAAELYGGSLPP